MQRDHPLLDLIGCGVQLRRDLTEPSELILDVADGGVPGDRLNAADSGADAALADDQEAADHGGFGDVAAAAEFIAVAVAIIRDGDGADALAILLAKERHRALSPRLAERFLDRLDRIVVQNRVVDLALDGAEFFRRQLGVIGEVEAQSIRRDQRAALLDRVAEMMPQRRLQ